MPVSASSLDLTTLAVAKYRLEISGTARDDALQTAITQASVAIQRRVRREIRQTASATTRTFRVPGSSRYVDLDPYDVAASPAPVVKLNPELGAKATTLTVDVDYRLEPVGGSIALGTYTAVELSSSLLRSSSYAGSFDGPLVSVNGTWGAFNAVGSVPDDIQAAACTTAGAWLDRAVAVYALEGLDDPRQAQADPASSWAIPAAAWSLISYLQRLTGV